MKLSSVFLKSINDIFSWNIVKLALIIGIPLGVVWFGIATLFWDQTISLTANFIGWIPFSVLKANAAFLIGGFSWVIVVLATYAVIMALFNIPIYKLLSPKRYEVFSIVLIITIAIGWTLFAIFKWDMVYSELEKVLTWFPFHTLQDGVSALLSMLIFYNLYIVSLYLVVMTFNKPFLEIIASKDYDDGKEINSVNKIDFVKIILRDIAIFFVSLILVFPLFFVPFINILIQVFLWAWFIKDAYFLSAANLFATKEEIKELDNHGLVKWGIAFVSSMLNLLPIVNIFAPFFGQTMFFHWIMINTNKK